MRKWLGRIIGVVVLAVIVPGILLLFAFPAKWEQSRTAVINADAETIFEWSRDMRLWSDWQPFQGKVPGTEVYFQGNPRRQFSGVSYLRPVTAITDANANDPAAIKAEEEARTAWWDSFNKLVETIGEKRIKARDLSDDAHLLNRKMEDTVRALRSKAKDVLRHSGAPEMAKFLRAVKPELDKRRSEAPWADSVATAVEAALRAGDSSAEIAPVMIKLRDDLKSSGGDTSWAGELRDRVIEELEAHGRMDWLRQLDKATGARSERRRLDATALLAQELEAAAAGGAGAALAETAKVLRESIEVTEPTLAKVLSMRAEAKALENEIDALQADRDARWARREIGSVTLLVAKQVDLPTENQKLLVALEKAGGDEFERDRYEEIVTAAGMTPAQADDLRDVLIREELVSVLPRPDRLRYNPKAPHTTYDRKHLVTILGIAKVWKDEIEKPNWESYSAAHLTNTEAEAGLKELLDYKLLTYNESKNVYIFADPRDYDSEPFPELSAVGQQALVTALGVGAKDMPRYLFQDKVRANVKYRKADGTRDREAEYLPDETRRPAKDPNSADEALQALYASELFKLIEGTRPETTRLEFRDGVGWSLVAGRGRLNARFHLAIRPLDNGCEVTWRASGTYGANPLHRTVGFFTKDNLGDDLEVGLAKLKALAKKGKPPEEEEAE